MPSGRPVTLTTPDLEAAVAKASARAEAIDGGLAALAERARDKRPEVLASEREKRQRRRFLEELYPEDRDAEAAFERIIAGNELQDANYLERGALVARTVMRIVLTGPGGNVRGHGTGFLVGDGVLITNNHVLPRPDSATTAVAEAFYERDLYGRDREPLRYRLDPDQLFATDKILDFTLVGVADAPFSGRDALASLGWLPLIGESGKATEGEWLSIIQHPRGERKQLCVRENQLLKRDDDVLWYSTDTLAGSSGSPVFNNDWLLVALHHSGVPETSAAGRWQTIDGRDWVRGQDGEDRIKWIANEGIRISRIVETLRTTPALANKPVVRAMSNYSANDVRAGLPVLYRDGRGPDRTAAPAPKPPRSPAPKDPAMASRRIDVTLEIDDEGNVSLVGGGAHEADLLQEAAGGRMPKKNIISAPIDPRTDWVGGFDTKFLGGGDLEVHLPKVRAAAKIAPLQDAYGQTFTTAESAAGVLNYKGYSVVMNKDRRFAFFSAANISAGGRTNIGGRDDDWLFDDRIDRAFQVDNSFYKGTKLLKNKFDRGHLTRREDMEWGSDPRDAVNRANGTCTWTNCSPQHEIFNQGKDPSVRLWQNLERYILEETAKANAFNVQVITGPVFGIADPAFRGIQYPLEYWKVVVAKAASGKLFATAYLLSQKATIDKFGIEEVDLEVPFGAFATYQRPIRIIEDLTGLDFTFGANKKLSLVDPLEKLPPSRRRRGSTSPQESLGTSSSDDALESFDDVVLGAVLG